MDTLDGVHDPADDDVPVGAVGILRIRTIKPEFWRSDDVTALSREDRLLFIGMWSYVDDNGVGIDDHRRVAADLFGLEDDQNEVREFVRTGLATLAERGLIVRYVVGGKGYVFIPSWRRHQKVDRPNKPRYPFPPQAPPPPPDGDDDPFATPSRVTRDDVASVVNGVSGGRVNGSVDQLVNGGEPNLFSDDGNALTSGSRETRDTFATPSPSGTEEQGNRGTEEVTTSVTADAATPKQPADPPGFEEFWSACPKKVGKGDARASYTKAIKRKGAKPATLLDAMERAARYWRLSGKDRQYIPNPATWLNQERWDDEIPEPPTHLAVVGGTNGPYASPSGRVPTTTQRVADIGALSKEMFGE